jgi:hypothetical protein
VILYAPAMSALAAAAAATAQPDWLARSIAIAGVLLAGIGLFQTRRLWTRAGPILAFDLYIIAFRIPRTDIVHRVQVRMEVTNVGRMAATVRSAEVRGPWASSFTQTDITQGGFPVLQPTEFQVSNGVDFVAPIEVVRAALQRKPSEDAIAEEIYKSMQVKAESLVRGRVRRGDDHPFTSARKTVIVYQEESWPRPQQGGIANKPATVIERGGSAMRRLGRMIVPPRSV